MTPMDEQGPYRGWAWNIVLNLFNFQIQERRKVVVFDPAGIARKPEIGSN